jgi:hypothetical protein
MQNSSSKELFWLLYKEAVLSILIIRPQEARLRKLSYIMSAAYTLRYYLWEFLNGLLQIQQIYGSVFIIFIILKQLRREKPKNVPFKYK